MNDKELPDKVLQALQLPWSSWEPLREAQSSAPETSGIYAIGLQCGIQYLNGTSRIIYIGSSKTLSSRLKNHFRQPQNKVIELLLESFSTDDLVATSWSTPKLAKRWLHGLEGELLWEFDRTFGTVPICNRDIPVSSSSDCFTDLLKISPCDELETSLGLDALAERLNRVFVIDEAFPIGNPNEVVLSMGWVTDADGNAVIGNDNIYRAARFLTPEEAAEDNETDIPVGEGCDWDVYVHTANIAAWSSAKMQEVIDICNQLSPIKTRAKTLQPFEAPFRNVPAPHTWGEVALLQARLISGDWRPKRSNIWVKVMHGKEVLGEGKLNKQSCYGCDISDLPQTKDRRQVCRDFDSDTKSFSVAGWTNEEIERVLDQIDVEKEQQERQEKLIGKIEAIIVAASDDRDTDRRQPV